jgi:hypothetical protein
MAGGLRTNDGLVFCVWNGVNWDCSVVIVLAIGYRI